jgi:hypothetical protein
MLRASTPPSKNTNWQTGLKRKTQKSVVYKKSTLLYNERVEEDLPS